MEIKQGVFQFAGTTISKIKRDIFRRVEQAYFLLEIRV